jgi:hypothetical protein
VKLPKAVACTLVCATAVSACSAPSPPAPVGSPPVSVSAAPAPSLSIQDGSLPVAPSAVAPAKLSIPKLGLTARVNAVGIDRSGEFLVPPSVDEVGWYKFGPGMEATAGSLVIAGHVDSAKEGKGAFFQLRTLAPGDQVSLTGPAGKTLAFVVTAREQYEKTKIPLDLYFARDGQLRLTLITCGGPFDQATRHYRDNIVVTAEPVRG